MIADILSEMVKRLDHYLNDSDFNHTYDGETRERIIRLRNEADELRSVLDAPPVVISPVDVRSDQTGSALREWIAWMLSDESAVIPAFFSQKDLFGRGWSKRRIGELLGGPDRTFPNPHGAGFTPMKCYLQDRVTAAEGTAEFKEHHSRKSKAVEPQI